MLKYEVRELLEESQNVPDISKTVQLAVCLRSETVARLPLTWLKISEAVSVCMFMCMCASVCVCAHVCM